MLVSVVTGVWYAGSSGTRGQQGDQSHLPAQWSHLHHGVQQDVGETVLATRTRPSQRANHHGGTGHEQWGHVPSLRPRHQSSLPLWQGTLGSSYSILPTDVLQVCMFKIYLES
jgi:hypothetical protein